MVVVARRTILFLALVASVRSSIQRFPVRDDDVLDLFVEERGREGDHFRSAAAAVAYSARAQDGAAPEAPSPEEEEEPEVKREVTDSLPAGSQVQATSATAPPGGGRRRHRTIPGKSGVDYPVHEHVPLTTFYCYKQPHPGYYADPEAGCQVFHVCNLDGRQDSFLCPPGTVFNQPYFVCDWWFNVDCRQAPQYYKLNRDMYRTVVKQRPTTTNEDHEAPSRTGRELTAEDHDGWNDGS